MLRQATVSDLITDRVSREKGYVVITMRRYPRFINKQLRDEYLTCMSPDKVLFEDWLTAKRKHDDHDGAFARSRFEERFDVGEDGLQQLERLCRMAEKKDVFLVCQCHEGKRCHREFTLILARKLFKAKAEKPKNAYPVFEGRIGEFRKKLSAMRKAAKKAAPKKAAKPARRRKAAERVSPAAALG
jgi:uncharacterized protein YeaO (DUF488 family)